MSFNQLEHLANVRTAVINRHKGERLNERRIMNCGIGATIIDYHTASDMTVKFDDGVTVYNQRYQSFKIGSIAHPGMRSCKHISVNEYIILWYFSKLGFQKAPSSSLKNLGFGRLELDCYNPNLKIAIEYDGVHWHKSDRKRKIDARKNKVCTENNIHLIRIREPGLESMTDCENFILDSTALFSQSLEQVLNILIHRMNTFIEVDFERDKDDILNDFAENNKHDKVGEISITPNGEKIEIIAYRTNQDIDVQFEDGVIVKHRRYDHFKEGFITKDPERYSDKEKERLGERKIMSCGNSCTITRYKNTDDINVTFDDGTVVEHRRYREFEKRQIIHPKNRRTNHKNMRLKETAFYKQGELMTIVDYISSSDVTVQFEDGGVVKHKKYDDFKRGNIRNPNRKKMA